MWVCATNVFLCQAEDGIRDTSVTGVQTCALAISELQFLVNKKVWKKLPADLKEILRVAMRTAAYDMYIQSYHASGENWSKMAKDYPKIKVKTFPKSVIAALKKANAELLAEAAAKSAIAKEIQDSQAAYMKKARVWTNISDKAYLDN